MGLELPSLDGRSFDIAVLGHLCLDHVILHHTTYPVRLGGPPVYIGLTARALGLRTQLISKIGDNFSPEHEVLLNKLTLSKKEFIQRSKYTTSYQLQYQNLGERKLKLLNKADPITQADFPYLPSQTAYFVVSPIAGEVSMDLLSWLSTQEAFLFVDVQGFIRQVKPDKEIVYSHEFKLPPLNPRRTILKGSEDEVQALTHTNDPATMVYRLAQYGVNVAIVTREKHGCVVFIRDESLIMDVSAFTSGELVDSTGAGDAFTAGFIKGLIETGSILDACKYGNATASFILETVGPAGFPTRHHVQERVKQLSFRKLALP